MQLEQLVDRRRAAAPPAAVGGDAEALHVAARAADPPARADLAVLQVQHAEVQLGPRIEAQLAQRREVLLLGLGRDRHVDPVQRAVQRRRQRVGDLDELARVVGHVKCPW